MDKPKKFDFLSIFFLKIKNFFNLFFWFTNCNNFFLIAGFSVIFDKSMSPYNDIIIVLGIGVADINKRSQFEPPFFAKSVSD